MSTIATEPTAVGARVRALREGMDLSLRDLAERSGVSAPMLSQVERGETSPTLAVAGKIAAGLELSLSQLLRLDEGDSVAVVRAAGRMRGGGPADARARCARDSRRHRRSAATRVRRAGLRPRRGRQRHLRRRPPASL